MKARLSFSRTCREASSSSSQKLAEVLRLANHCSMRLQTQHRRSRLQQQLRKFCFPQAVRSVRCAATGTIGPRTFSPTVTGPQGFTKANVEPPVMFCCISEHTSRVHQVRFFARLSETMGMLGNARGPGLCDLHFWLNRWLAIKIPSECFASNPRRPSVSALSSSYG